MPEAMTTALSILLAILLLVIVTHLQAVGTRPLPVLMYHKVRPGPPDALTVPLEIFNAQLDALRPRATSRSRSRICSPAIRCHPNQSS